MIKTKQDLVDSLSQELGAYHNALVQLFVLIATWIRGGDSLPRDEVLYTLRKYEFYKNNPSKNPFSKLKKIFWHIAFRNRQLKHSMFIEPNVLGTGATIMHPGFRKIPTFSRIGKGSTILPMVLIGRKTPTSVGDAIIGENCYISTGVTILAPVKIGNNVTIGAGAVVTKDIPDNTTVAGVPARNIH